MLLHRSIGRAVARSIAISTALLAAGIAAPATADPPLEARGRCEVEFFASSTLHDFSGTVRSKPFSLAPHVDPRSGEAWWSGSVEVPVADMDTGIEQRDENLRAMLEADRFPRIVASVDRLDREGVLAMETRTRSSLPVKLTIRDVTRPVDALVSHWRQEGGAASFEVEFEVSLEHFGLEAPVVLGLIRVHDVVRVRSRVTVDLPPSIARLDVGPA